MSTNVHINQCPTGRYNFVGTLPARLGDVVTADRAAILGNRTLDQRGPNNEILMIKFLVFLSLAGAHAHAVERGVAVCDNPDCACSS